MKAEINKYFFLCFLLFLSCKTGNKKSLSSIITLSNCYWDIHDSESTSLGRSAYCYKFTKDGHCSYFFYDKRGKRNGYDFDDVVVPKTWKLTGDTILYLQGTERKVLSFSEDTLLLENPVSKQRDTLIKSCQ